MGIPLVITHLQMDFPWNQPSSELGDPLFMETPIWFSDFRIEINQPASLGSLRKMKSYKWVSFDWAFLSHGSIPKSSESWMTSYENLTYGDPPWLQNPPQWCHGCHGWNMLKPWATCPFFGGNVHESMEIYTWFTYPSSTKWLGGHLWW